MMPEPVYQRPRWLRDLLRFLPLKSQFVLTGNIRDLQTLEISAGNVNAFALSTVLASELTAHGYAHVIQYEPTTGFSMAEPIEGAQSGAEAVLNGLGITPSNGVASAGLDFLTATIGRLCDHSEGPLALIVDFASRLIVRNEFLQPHEHQLFSRAQVLSHATRPRPYGPQNTPFFNVIIWIVDKEGDLPDWFLFNNSRIRHIPVAKPDATARRVLSHSLLRTRLCSQNVLHFIEVQQQGMRLEAENRPHARACGAIPGSWPGTLSRRP